MTSGGNNGMAKKTETSTLHTTTTCTVTAIRLIGKEAVGPYDTPDIKLIITPASHPGLVCSNNNNEMGIWQLKAAVLSSKRDYQPSTQYYTCLQGLGFRELLGRNVATSLKC